MERHRKLRGELVWTSLLCIVFLVNAVVIPLSYKAWWSFAISAFMVLMFVVVFFRALIPLWKKLRHSRIR